MPPPPPSFAGMTMQEWMNYINQYIDVRARQIYDKLKGSLNNDDSGSKVSYNQVDFDESTKIGSLKIDGESHPISAPAVSVDPELTSGTKIASIGVGGHETSIFAPKVEVEQKYTDGTEIARITIGGTSTPIKAPPSGVQSVSVTPINTTGTPIAKIDVDGTETTITAPKSGV